MSMGRNKNRRRRSDHQIPELEFDPPKVQSSLVQSTSLTQSKGKDSLRSEIKNTNLILSEGSSFSVSDFEEEIYTKKVKFSIKQWLLLGMSRIVPHNDKAIFISMKENSVRGPKDKVEKFCDEAEKEIKQMKMKVLKFKYEISSEDVQFEMEKDWRCQIFSGKLLKNVADKIQQKYDIKNQMRNEIESILKKDGINNLTRFLWVKSDAYDQAYEILFRIHKERSRNLDENQKTIGSILNEMALKQSNYRQDRSKNLNSSSSSHQRTNQEESQSNSSADYSTILKNKKNSELESQNSSRILKNEKKIKYKQKKDKQLDEERRKNQETRYLSPKSSMKSLNPNLDDSNFTFFQSINAHSVVQDDRRQRPPRRGRRQGQERNAHRINRYHSDESSENEQDRHETQRRYVPRRNREPRRKIIFAQQYPEQYFSKQHFNNWRRNNKTLKHVNKYVLEINSKFSPEDLITYIQVAFYGDDPKGDIIYAINMYFKFEKLIKIKEEQQIRDKMIDKFQCKHNWITVEYKKIFTREKFPKFEELRRLAKKDNTAQFMNENKNVTHAFLITGLSPQVSSMQAEIKQFVKDVRNSCRRVDIELKFPFINDFMRRKEVHNLIEETVRQQISRFPKQYKLQKITPTFTQILAEIDIFDVQDKDVGKVKAQLTEKLVALIEHFEYQSEKYKKFKKVFATILQKYIIFENSKNGLTLIAKKDNIKEQMDSINKQIEKNFATTIKQFPVKQKSELTLCRDFLLNQLKQPEFNSVNIRYDEKQTLKIELIGYLFVVENLFSKLEEYYETIEARIAEYNIQLTEQQLQIIEKDKQGQKKIQQDFIVALKFKYDYKIGAVFVIQPQPQHGIKYPKKSLVFQNEFNFQGLPKQSVFFFRNFQEITSIKQPFILPIKNHIKSQPRSSQPVIFQDKIKECFFIYGYEAEPQTILLSSKNTSSNNVLNIFMYTPEPWKSINDFIKEMINLLSKNKDFLSKEFKITFIYKKTADLKKILTFQEGKVSHSNKIKRNWYILQGKTKLFYSDIGNKKIQEAFINKVAEIELNNEDLNLTNKSHRLEFSNKSMVHIQSGKNFPFKILSNRITFTLNGQQKEIPNVQFQKIPKNKRMFWIADEYLDCQLSIGFYKIDMKNLVQTNLFSNFSRNIGCDQVEIKEAQNYQLQVNYDVKSTKLGLEYSVENENLVKKAEIFIKEFLEKKLISKTKPFQNQFTLDLAQKFTKEAEQQNVSIEIAEDKKSFILKAYNEKNIETFLRILSHLAKTQKTQVTYPTQWEPQMQDIQTFIVAPNTQEFNKVQTAFTAGRITQLVRIQNKIVFRKFSEEKLFLKELNNGKDVKQMLLYHGTKSTDPKLIYEDKQECFNVNYTSQHNLLGKGIYFAQNSEYSVDYSHPQDQINRISSMFYCCVLVGQSEKCPGHNGNIRDTNFKDQSKRLRYESMTDYLNRSNVYVVYKNRRAYPLYLIKYRR